MIKNIIAVMTAGRYENTFARNCIESALKSLAIPLTVSGGVYYGQCMQMMFENVCKSDCDLVVTVDGDSIFKPEQLKRMIGLICQDESIDALAALQVKRGSPDVLGTVHGERTVGIAGSPIKVATAHFGLTVIKVEKLRQLEKPWFFAQPNELGMWDGNKTDADVWFWLQWEKQGHSAFIDPQTRIGHLEEMVSCFDENMKPCHCYPADWGKP